MNTLHLSIITIIGIVVIAATSIGVFVGKLGEVEQQPHVSVWINETKENYTIGEPISFSTVIEGFGSGCGETKAIITKENDSQFQPLGWTSEPSCVYPANLHYFKFNSMSENTRINQTGNYALRISFVDLTTYRNGTTTYRFSVMPEDLSVHSPEFSSDNGSADAVVNPNTNRIYVANEVSHTVSVIDGNTNAKIADIPTSAMPSKIAINPNTNRIYVTEGNWTRFKESGAILVIDGTNNEKIAEMQYNFFPQIAINQKTNLIYVIGYDRTKRVEQNGTLYVIDGNDNAKIAQVQAGINPFGITVNPNTDRIYILNKHYPVNSKWENSTVSVIDGRNNTKIADVEVGIYPAGIAVNPNTDRIYVTNYNSGTVSVIDGASNSVIGKPIFLGSGVEGLAVDPIANRIYVADGISSTVYVIDGNADTKIKEMHPLYGWNVAVNPVTDRIYVPSYILNNISVIDGKSYDMPSVIQMGPYPENIKNGIVVIR